MLPYDGITRTGSKGVSHFVTKTPSEGGKVLESKGKGKLGMTKQGKMLGYGCGVVA